MAQASFTPRCQRRRMRRWSSEEERSSQWRVNGSYVGIGIRGSANGRATAPVPQHAWPASRYVVHVSSVEGADMFGQVYSRRGGFPCASLLVALQPLTSTDRLSSFDMRRSGNGQVHGRHHSRCIETSTCRHAKRAVGRKAGGPGGWHHRAFISAPRPLSRGWKRP